MARLRRTPMQELFFKQIQRLKRAISREFRKSGVELKPDLIPKMPKRVTQKQLENIRQIKPKDLRRETKYYDPEDLDREITYEEAKRIWSEEQRNAQYIPTIDVDNRVIESFRDTYSKFNDDFKRTMDSWINRLRNQYGDSAVSQMLMEGAENGLIITYKEAYDEAKMIAFQSEMLSYLDMNARTKEEILSEIERQVGYEEPE